MAAPQAINLISRERYEYLQRVRELMKLPIIFDGRNVMHGENAVHAGFEYHSVGRKSLYPQNPA